jgi:hypothetical protein
LFTAQELFDSGFDGGEVGEVEFEEFQAAVGVWVEFLNLIDGGGAF